MDLYWVVDLTHWDLNKPKSRKGITYVAPSWPWASLDVPIWEDTLGIHNETPVWHIAIQELDIQLAGQDPFSQPVGAKLSLSCSVLLQVTVVFTKTGSYMLFGDQEVGPEHMTKYDTDVSDCMYYI